MTVQDLATHRTASVSAASLAGSLALAHESVHPATIDADHDWADGLDGLGDHHLQTFVRSEEVPSEAARRVGVGNGC